MLKLHILSLQDKLFLHRDTFANFDGWHKGVLIINGFNVGRYWPVEGPQQTLYVPSTILKGNCQPNKVVVFEQDKVKCYRKKNRGSCTIEFVTEPVINGTVPVQLAKTFGRTPSWSPVGDRDHLSAINLS